MHGAVRLEAEMNWLKSGEEENWSGKGKGKGREGAGRSAGREVEEQPARREGYGGHWKREGLTMAPVGGGGWSVESREALASAPGFEAASTTLGPSFPCTVLWGGITFVSHGIILELASSKNVDSTGAP